MPDGAIVVPDTAAVPKDYTLEGTQEILLKSVSAEIDGSGAAGSFKPTLQMLDPNGHICWEGETPDALAAGASARVSWFPGLGGSSGATPSASVVMPYASVSVAPWTWTQLGGTFVNFGAGSVTTTDSSVFQDNSFVAPTSPILIMKAGIYIAWASIGPWDPAWGTQALLANIGPALGTWGGGGNTATNYPITFAPLGGITGSSPSLVTFTNTILTSDPPGGSEVRMEVSQASGADRSVSAFISIVRLTANGLGV